MPFKISFLVTLTPNWQRFWPDLLSYIQRSGQLLSHKTLLLYVICHAPFLMSMRPWTLFSLRSMWLPKLLGLHFEKFSKKGKSWRDKPLDYNNTVYTFLFLGRQGGSDQTKHSFLFSVLCLALTLQKNIKKKCIWHIGLNNFTNIRLVTYEPPKNSRLLSVFVCFIFWDRVLCSPGKPPNHYSAKTVLEPQIFLPIILKC